MVATLDTEGERRRVNEGGNVLTITIIRKKKNSYEIPGKKFLE